MNDVRQALLDTNVLIALITAVLGPIALAVVTWATTRRRAEKAAEKGKPTGLSNPDDPGNVSQQVLAWATELRKDVRGLREEVHRLRDRVVQLEIENDRLVRHNRLLTTQVIDLGGKPHPRPE